MHICDNIWYKCFNGFNFVCNNCNGVSTEQHLQNKKKNKCGHGMTVKKAGTWLSKLNAMFHLKLKPHGTLSAIVSQLSSVFRTGHCDITTFKTVNKGDQWSV